jgi:hypothetical protein
MVYRVGMALHKRIIGIALAVGLILLVPLVAMRFTGEVSWTLSDFVVMGALLFITGLGIDLAWRKMGKYRIVGAIVVVVAFLWLWVELAVGLFTNWGS